MKICFVNLYHRPGAFPADPAAYLAAVPTLASLPAALARRGHEVHVVHASSRDDELRKDGVTHHFRAIHRSSRLVGAVLSVLSRRPRAVLTPAPRAIRQVVDLDPDLVHFHGTTMHLGLALLSRSLAAAAPRTPIVLHHHGGQPSPHRRLRWLQKRSWSRASRLLVSSPALGQEYVDAGVVEARRVAELMETSSAFQRLPREQARRQSGFAGAPVFLSAARLDPIKDPWTVLRGFARIVEAWPDARLYLCYREGVLAAELQARVAAHATLSERVHFCGARPYAEMEAIMNSADFLLQASRREWSGVAVLDAMACGVIPVLSRIPSFETMTANGRFGAHFEIGDDQGLARAVLAIPRGEIAVRSAAVRRHFEQRFSFDRLAAQLEAIDREIIGRRPDGRP